MLTLLFQTTSTPKHLHDKVYTFEQVKDNLKKKKSQMRTYFWHLNIKCSGDLPLLTFMLL